MTDILIDQKVLIYIVQKKKNKIFKHLKNMGLDFAILSFQWLVWLLASNMAQNISELIWDFLFLEGTVALFKAILAILSIMEQLLLKHHDFNDLYVILDTKPQSEILNERIFIKHMAKFSSIKQKHINELRKKFR